MTTHTTQFHFIRCYLYVPTLVYVVIDVFLFYALFMTLSRTSHQLQDFFSDVAQIRPKLS